MGDMTTLHIVAITLIAWWLLFSILGAGLMAAAVQNTKLLGIRTFHAEERTRRFNQWLALPLVSYASSVVTGVATGFAVSDRWEIGILLISLGFFGIVTAGGWLGMMYRADRPDRWDRLESVEALHAEVDAAKRAGRIEPRHADAARRHVLGFMEQHQKRWRPALMKPMVDAGLAWKDCHRFGLVVLRDKAGRRIRVPTSIILRGLLRTPTLWVPLVGCLACAGIFPVFYFRFSEKLLLGLVLAAVVGMIPFVVAFTAARASLIYRTRSWLDTDSMLAEISASIEELRDDSVKMSSKGRLARLLTPRAWFGRQI
jgi:hypothetical protein